MADYDYSRLIAVLGIEDPLIGFYDVPDTTPFEPLIKPADCIYEHVPDWRSGRSIALSPLHIGCRGAGYWLCGQQTQTTDQLISFLRKEEGLKDSEETLREWVAQRSPYRIQHGSIVIGPLRPDQTEYLRTVTFFVTPDQLAMLITGVEYKNAGASVLTRAPFASGCLQLAPPLEDEDMVTAWISMTDVAMRKFIPNEILGFTVTKPAFSQLCALGDDSFLGKRFWSGLRESRSLRRK